MPASFMTCERGWRCEGQLIRNPASMDPQVISSKIRNDGRAGFILPINVWTVWPREPRYPDHHYLRPQRPGADPSAHRSAASRQSAVAPAGADAGVTVLACLPGSHGSPESADRCYRTAASRFDPSMGETVLASDRHTQNAIIGQVRRVCR
jgi:hypothetical protein